jgi:putative ABC transport system permease protein
MMSLDPSLVHYSDAQTEQFYKQLADRARAVRGVKSIALASAVPMSVEGCGGDRSRRFPVPAGKDSATVFASRVDENYFDVLAVPLVRGRTFRETDSSNAPRVVIVNEQLAQHYWPGGDAIGKRLRG